jgi:hypothetical protein|tara:strand:- start:332 stop:622 length:291 start_codon:yes stop_codon:yes gene_type:complete
MTDQKDGVIHEAMRQASVPRSQIDPNVLLADGFDKALLGFGYQFYRPVAVYSKDRCLHVLMDRDGMSREDAMEYFDFNVAGSWVGEGMPVFMEDLH